MRYLVKANCKTILTSKRVRPKFYEALDRHIESILITANELRSIKTLDENHLAMLTNGKLGLLKVNRTHTTPKQDATPLVASCCSSCHTAINELDAVLIVDPKARENYKTKHLKETPTEKQLCYKCWLKVFAVVKGKWICKHEKQNMKTGEITIIGTMRFGTFEEAEKFYKEAKASIGHNPYHWWSYPEEEIKGEK